MTAGAPTEQKCPFTGKESWPSKAEARASLARMRRRGDWAVRVYRCACGGWHTTSRGRR